MNPVGNEIMLPSLTYNSCAPSGIKENNSASSSFLVYPNPVNDVLKIKINALKPTVSNSYSIYDVVGKVLIHKELGAMHANALEVVDMSSLATGLYFVSVTTDGVTSTKQVAKN